MMVIFNFFFLRIISEYYILNSFRNNSVQIIIPINYAHQLYITNNYI